MTQAPLIKIRQQILDNFFFFQQHIPPAQLMLTTFCKLTLIIKIIPFKLLTLKQLFIWCSNRYNLEVCLTVNLLRPLLTILIVLDFETEL